MLHVLKQTGDSEMSNRVETIGFQVFADNLPFGDVETSIVLAETKADIAGLLRYDIIVLKRQELSDGKTVYWMQRVF